MGVMGKCEALVGADDALSCPTAPSSVAAGDLGKLIAWKHHRGWDDAPQSDEIGIKSGHT